MEVVTITVIIAIFSVASGIEPPVVDIPTLGNIEGSYGQSLNGRTFYAFEGIPYAQPPVGKYRFKDPVPVKPWKGVWTAKTLYKCMQYTHYPPPDDTVIGDEDCLYLNIYTPTLDENANLDVIVYIHGGAFMFFYPSVYGPRFVMDKKVIYINLNYRLGPLGFLSTEDDTVPGNNGIKDQILALEWIKKNVKYFGGNPNSVMISGMSAGGASVHMHYLTPKSKGLFYKGISQSGTALNPWVLMENPLEKTKKIAANLGCRTKNVHQMMECLRNRPARQIVYSVKMFQPWLYNPFSPFGVVVDSWASDPVLPDHPINLIKNKQFNDVPWITSQTNFEGMYPASDFYHEEYLDEIDSRWNELIPFILDYNYTIDLKLQDKVSQKIRNHFLGNRKVDKTSFTDFVDIISERLFDIDIQKAARLQASVSNSPVYYYYFTYCGAHNWYEPFIGLHKNFGAAHAEDTAYVFSTPADTTTTEDDRKMIKLFVEMFTSFAKNGKPNVPVEWLPLEKHATKKSLNGLQINSATNLTMAKIYSKNEQFWSSLPFHENENLFSDIKDEL